jgi:lipid-binding SYLF domain-containing protein
MRTCTIMLALLVGAAPLALTACSTYRETDGSGETGTERLMRQAAEARETFLDADPSLEAFFDGAHAHAIFPRVAKGAAGIGAANGDGVVYRGGQPVALTELTQVDVGLQLGGQSFSQVIFFQDERAFERFKRGDVEFSANASAVAADKGAAAANDYEDGVAVFSMTRGGLMFEASIGGQEFDYEPLEF